MYVPFERKPFSSVIVVQFNVPFTSAANGKSRSATPLILVISALSALLWHWSILKWITRGFGLLFQKTMGLGGASALAVAVNIFLGMIESPIVIRAYLDKLTRSELFLMMVVGLATVGSVAERLNSSISTLPALFVK